MKRIFIFLLFFSLPYMGYSQRTVNGQPSLKLATSINTIGYGALLTYSQYQIAGYWDIGLNIRNGTYNYKLNEEQIRIPLSDLSIEAGYKYRLASNLSRSICLYGGCGSSVGIELVDYFNKLPPYIDKSNLKSFSVFGIIYAEISTDIYIFRRFAITTGLRANAGYGMFASNFFPSAYIGFKTDI